MGSRRAIFLAARSIFADDESREERPASISYGVAYLTISTIQIVLMGIRVAALAAVIAGLIYVSGSPLGKFHGK